MSGWICLHRKLLDWEWYSDHNTKILFIHCLLRANHSDAKWKGQNVNRGQFISSLESLSRETGLTISQVRTSIKKLKSTNEIAEKSQARNRVVTVLGYDAYQDNSKQVSRLVTARSQGSDSEIATDNNENNDNNETKEINGDKSPSPKGPKFDPTITDDKRINLVAWSEWCEDRKQRRKPISKATQIKQFKLLHVYDYQTQQEIIDASINAGWTGLFAPKGKGGQPVIPSNQEAPNQIGFLDNDPDQSGFLGGYVIEGELFNG